MSEGDPAQSSTELKVRRTPTAETPMAGDSAWEEGKLVSRRYQLDRMLGSGAMGDVWLAADTLLGKQVALKVLQAEIAQSRETVHRFRREVALAHSVTHAHVVRIYDTGESEGRPFFTMEYLQGQTLQERLDSQSDDPKGLELKELRRIAYDVLDGLEAAHRSGVVHRDLKPGNVMLTHRGAIVMDFGVAGIDEAPAVAPDAAAVRSLIKTEAGTIFGSPAYMAPELWEGEPASIKTDIYAFGIMLYQMVTGRLPFRGSSPAAYLQEITRARPRSIRSMRRDTPWYLTRLIRRCMAVDPEQRPPSASAAANLIAPLRNENRRRLIFGGVALTTALGVGWWAREPMDRRHQGLPNATVKQDLGAALRALDIGETRAALRGLDRLARQAPGSPAVRFWQAVTYHQLGDDTGRLRACEREVKPQGSRAWKEMAERACAETFSLGELALATLEDPEDPDSDQLLPLAIRWHVLPHLEAEPASQGPEHDRAEALLAVLGEASGPDDQRTAWAQRRLARVDLQIALGRIEEANARLTALTDTHPDVPLFGARAAWLASHVGNPDRARALGERLRPVDPSAWLLEEMEAGKMRDAWAAIAPYRGTPLGEGLRVTWCGYAWRFEVTPRPPQCQDLPPGLVRDVWEGDGVEPTSTSPLELEILAARNRLANLDCTQSAATATVLTHAPAGFELCRAELELESALCEPDPAALDTGRAQEVGSRLAAVAPTNPWVLIALARADDARDAPQQAVSRRLAAAERWRDADSDLPVVAGLRRALDERPSGPRTAAAPGGGER